MWEITISAVYSLIYHFIHAIAISVKYRRAVFFFIALFLRMEFRLLELKLKLKSYSCYKPWSILRYAVGLTNANKKHTWNETAIIIIIMSWSIGTVYTKPWFWRKVFIASFFPSFSPLLSMITAKEWVHLHFFVILAKTTLNTTVLLNSNIFRCSCQFV